MRILLTLLWRLMVKLARRLGWGAMLVPVAFLGMALFGLTLWTVAAIVLAAAVAVRRPAAAAGLVPVAMVCLGVSGLVMAAAAPGAVAAWAAPAFDLQWQAVTLKPLRLKLPAKPAVPVVIYGKQVRMTITRVTPRFATAGEAGPPGFLVPGRSQVVARPVPSSLAKRVIGPQWRPAPPSVRWIVVKRGGPVIVTQGRRGQVPAWLLVPLALLLLTVGLWLMPRTVARLRDRAGPLVPYLRCRAREAGWGLLLVPATLFGLTVFGVHAWSAGLVIAAAVVTIGWPEVAADLVPVVLVVLAIRGFVLAAQWQQGAPFLRGTPVQYGFVPVDGRQSALAAGAEASGLMALGAWLVPRTILAHLRTLRHSEPDLAGRVQWLTETRGHALDAATTELRRIERDLHDGAQARLVALGMNLRAVERVIPANPQAALALVAEARESSVRALNELRDLIRGICPPVLADRGLGHAVRALALDTPMPIDLDISLPGRLSAPVESAAYFAVAEALANAVKHSGARRVQIRIQHAACVLRIEVSDDGAGGADPAGGTGLAGVERRLGTFDGILAVNSPPGGPTMIVMEVPCALSSPKTCSC